jgi:hypothetical protein
MSYTCSRAYVQCIRTDFSFNDYNFKEYVEVELTLRLTVSQAVSISLYRAPLWDLQPDISCRNVAV